MNKTDKQTLSVNTASKVTNYIECPQCGDHQKVIWNYFPEDVICHNCSYLIGTEGFEPSVVIYRKSLV